MISSDVQTLLIIAPGSEAVSQKFNGLLSALEENKSDPNYVRIHDDLVFKMKLMDSIDAWKEYFKGITYTIDMHL